MIFAKPPRPYGVKAPLQVRRRRPLRSLEPGGSEWRRRERDPESAGGVPRSAARRGGAVGGACGGVRARSRDDALRIRSRWFSNDCLEVVNEVCLVGVAKVQGQLRQLHSTAGQPYGRFVEPIALDHPLGADPDVLTEQTLERSC